MITQSFSNVCRCLKNGELVSKPRGRDNESVRTREYQVCFCSTLFGLYLFLSHSLYTYMSGGLMGFDLSFFHSGKIALACELYLL